MAGCTDNFGRVISGLVAIDWAEYHTVLTDSLCRRFGC
jgi:hypothetical protein